jgi:hypothetical protein
MSFFSEIFDRSSIYEMLFFNVKSVLTHPTIDDLMKSDKKMYENWKALSEKKYYNTQIEYTYDNYACNFPEYCKIVAITYGWVHIENNEMKKEIKGIVDDDESIVIRKFMDVLHNRSSDAVLSSPQLFPILTGYNIINHDIPLLIKRFFLYRKQYEGNAQLPLILKKSLDVKPWEGNIVDIVNVWRFNGSEVQSLSMIADFLGLKMVGDLSTNAELSKYYWGNMKKDPQETLKYISIQSAIQTNLCMQLLNEIRSI